MNGDNFNSYSNLELVSKFEYDDTPIIRELCFRLYNACLSADETKKELESCIDDLDEDIGECIRERDEAEELLEKAENRIAELEAVLYAVKEDAQSK